MYEKFKYTYWNYVQPIEQYYVNIKDDKGGETYGGIARNIFPNWEGWKVIDAWKTEHGDPKWNQQITEADPLVEKFFMELWNKLKFESIDCKSVAAIIFDWFVNTIKVYAATGSSVPIKRVQKLLGFEGKDVDGISGNKTIGAINAANSEKLFDQIKEIRIAFYDRLIELSPNQEQFRAGWYKRINRFKYEC